MWEKKIIKLTKNKVIVSIYFFLVLTSVLFLDKILITFNNLNNFWTTIIQLTIIIVGILPLLYVIWYKNIILKEALSTLSVRESTLKSILDSMEEGVIACDKNGKITFINRAHSKITGQAYTPSTLDFYTKEAIVIHPNSETPLTKHELPLHKALHGEETTKEKILIKNKAGEQYTLKVTSKQIRSDNGEVLGALTIANNITKEEQAIESFQESEQRYKHLADLLPISIFVHVNDRLAYINQSGAKMIGANHPTEIIGKPASDFIPPELKKKSKKRREHAIKTKKQLKPYDTKLQRLDGTTMDVQANSTAITYHGKPAILGINIDITKQKKALERIKHMAYHDALTNLPNRRYFNKILKQKIYEAKKHNQSPKKFAILFFDIHNFEHINDWLGHSYGDQLLKQITKRLTSNLPEGVFTSRIAGDEFTLITPYFSEKAQCEKLANDILANFHQPFPIQDMELNVSANIGISIYPSDGETIDTLVKNSDLAMFEAKKKGLNSSAFYSPSFHDPFIERRKMEHELERAIKEKEFILFYQPQICSRTREVCGMEALIRWEHPARGLVSPGEFIPIAEETEYIVRIGEWVLTEACMQNKRWQEEGYSPIPVKVNLSTRQFFQTDIVKTVSTVLAETALEPQYLELEITESIMMKNKNEATKILHALKKLGVGLALDDFGTGYSSLAYLKDFPIDTIKIDKSFIHDLFHDVKSKAIVKNVINLAHSLELNVIAEGVETKEQEQFLIQQHCHQQQGYYFSRPKAAKDTEWDQNDGDLRISL
ncbi:EAL domain-containing protein [Evansella sp. AB-P1]|uniref:EAL domain-containing protein n=1 Tax=Evansella sp. AB-P1 TaxID=3037653 RepID=UPI0024200B59|nr:EAL domain-containing protein [Evansella sp. AB-P1]MDG5786801.1 EAL domain-containing protein [Evansella sp. AB-P1]